MISFKFPIPEKVSANKVYDSTMHWAVRKKLADLYHKYMLAHKSHVSEYPVDMSYIFTFKKNPLDVSNTFLMVKLIEDGLVRNGTLEGDSPEFVGSISVHSQKGNSDEVEIIIV